MYKHYSFKISAGIKLSLTTLYCPTLKSIKMQIIPSLKHELIERWIKGGYYGKGLSHLVSLLLY